MPQKTITKSEVTTQIAKSTGENTTGINDLSACVKATLEEKAESLKLDQRQVDGITSAIRKVMAGKVSDSELSQKDVANVIDGLREVLNTELAAGNNVNIDGIGKFMVVDCKARKGRNPKTGETMDIPARKRVKMKPSKKITDKVAEGSKA